MKTSIITHILTLDQERKSLIYDYDKVLPKNRERFEEIQKKLMDIEERYHSG